MNASDDENDQQRSIEAKDQLDRKIAQSPSPYAWASGGGDDGKGGSRDDEVAVKSKDILCGRGKDSYNHEGNKEFRDIIANSVNDYVNAQSRLDKSLLVHRIVEEIREAGGRFLKRESGKWKVLSDRAAKDKVSHAVRDAANARKDENQQQQRQQQQRHFSWPSVSYEEMKMEAPILGPSSIASLTQSMFPGFSAFHHSSPSLYSDPPVADCSQRPHSAPADDEQDYEQKFLEHIDEVLGPMPPNPDDDPLADLLDLA